LQHSEITSNGNALTHNKTQYKPYNKRKHM